MNLGEGPDPQERQGATVEKGRGRGAGHHRKLLGTQCACLPTGTQWAERSRCNSPNSCGQEAMQTITRTPSTRTLPTWNCPRQPALDCDKLQFCFPKFTEKEKHGHNEEAQKPFPLKATGEFTWSNQQWKEPMQSDRLWLQKGESEGREDKMAEE